MPDAALRERAGERPVFAAAEYERRIERARATMAAERIDVLVLRDPQSLAYFTGYRTVNLWDFSALVIPAAGPPFALLWDFELPRFDVSAAAGEPWAYTAAEDPVERLVRLVAGLQPGTWAADDWFDAGAVAARIGPRLPTAERAGAHAVLRATRLVKSPAEIDLLRRSAALTDVGMAAARDVLAPGVEDRELAAAAAAAMLRGGSGHFAIQPIVAVGARAGIAHSEASGVRVEAGKGVFVEIGANVDGYTAPLMRTLVAGEPEGQLAELEHVAVAALAAALAELRPGVAASAVAAAVDAVVADAGGDVLYHGCAGYPVGQCGPPSWLESLDFLLDAGNDRPLAEGMVFHLPLSFRHRGLRGVGLSQTAVVGPGGGTVLSSIPATLWRKEV